MRHYNILSVLLERFCERKGFAFREAHSSGTTVAAKGGEGDGADSPTRAKRSGSPKSFFINKQDMISKLSQKSDKNNNFSKRLTKDE
jgi:hypothetical protein